MEHLTPFQRFIALIKFDQQAISLNKTMHELRKEVELTEAQKKDLDNSLESANKNVQSAEKEVHLQELHMKELQEREATKKELLTQTQEDRAYQALKKEIETIRRAQTTCENELIQSWNKLETAKKGFENIQKTVLDKIAEFDTAITEKSSQLSRVTEELEQHKQERTRMEVDLPEDWLEKYNAMYLEVVNPIVPLISQSCSACFHEVTRQEYKDLQKKQLLQCKGCFRLIYIES